DAAAVVLDRGGAVGAQPDVDVPAVAGHRLVDGVVDDLEDEVVEPARRDVADVHGGPQADRLEAFQHLDRGGGVRAALLRVLAVAAAARGRRLLRVVTSHVHPTPR